MSSSSSGSLRRRQTIACQQINVLGFCSTPIIGKSIRPNTLSVSTIDTNSSSSRKRQGKNQSELKRKVLRKRISKHRKNLRHKKRDSQKEEERKETIDIDKDWETCNEYSPVKNVTSDSDKCVLFKDLSPEKTRDAPNFIEYRLKSPILQSRTLWQIDSPKRISIEEKEKTWPLEDLSFSTALHLNNDDEEEEHTLSTLSLKTENVVKTYPGCRKRERRNNVSVEKCKQWLLRTSFPTVASNLLWDKFVKENYHKIRKYLKHPDNDKYNISLGKHCSGKKKDNDKISDDDDCDSIFPSEKQEQNSKFIKELKLPKNMVRVRGHWNKSLKKWDRFENVYRYPNSENSEFEENDRIKKMSLEEFLQECRTRKTKEQFLLQKKKQSKKRILLRSSSSSPMHQGSVEKNSKSSINNKK
ncbi:unnamed protein product [Xylocopa violacea]|uniref:Uncharacterized protein n=1 Tax=Xylocopa violacea TaxID=135666 RepID=A0ABP1N1N2_XYLVO